MGSAYGEMRKIRAAFAHPRYNPRTDDHDFAVLVMDRPVKFNEFISPIKLPEVNTKNGPLCKIVGWQMVRKAGKNKDNYL